MRTFSSFILAVCLLASCGEPYKNVDPTEFNHLISGKTDINTPSALISLYYPKINDGVEPVSSIETKKLGHNEFEIIMINEHLGDDSQSAERIVMLAHRSKKSWTVSEIRISWKCYEGRGSTEWNATPCE